MKDFIKSYLKDTSGNIAMMFGILSVPLMICTGMAIDISRLQSFDHKLQNATDAAVLHGVQLSVVDDAELTALTRIIFEQNLNYPDVEITYFDAKSGKDGSVNIIAKAQIPAVFPQVVGYPKMQAAGVSDADADSGEDLEMVIAFDTTNSMGFGSTWTTAMGTLNNILTEIEQYTGEDNFYVSLLPYSDRVNVGTENDDWLTAAAPADWNGCVEPREETSHGVDWYLSNEKPVGQDRFEASIVGVTGGLATRGGGYPHCPSVAITGPTNNVSEVIAAANSLSKSGTGRFDVGMAWAWRLMSRKWRTELPGLHNSGAADKKRRQIAILVTDGKTEAYTWEVDKQRDWAYNEGSIGGFENMVRVCDDMKADDMEIFMIRVNGNEHASSYMKDCASTDLHYHEISTNGELEIAFKEVLKVVKANVRLTN